MSVAPCCHPGQACHPSRCCRPGQGRHPGRCCHPSQGCHPGAGRDPCWRGLALVVPGFRLPRAAPGAARRGLTLVRSVLRPTALRCPVLRPRRGTRCVRCALCAETTATRQLTSRAAREAASPGLAGRAGPVAQPLARHKQSTGLFVSGARLLGAPEARCSLGARAFASRLLTFGRLEPGTQNTTNAASRQALPGGARGSRHPACTSDNPRNRGSRPAPG